MEWHQNGHGLISTSALARLVEMPKTAGKETEKFEKNYALGKQSPIRTQGLRVAQIIRDQEAPERTQKLERPQRDVICRLGSSLLKPNRVSFGSIREA